MPCYPGYRYCGPYCSGPGAPINRLDAICKEHDRCYRSRNHLACDTIFLSQTQQLQRQSTKMGRDARFMNQVIANKRRRF